MRLSLFKIGLLLVVLGSIWIALVFENSEKIQEQKFLKEGTSFEIKSDFDGMDIGFYKVFMPEFEGQEIFVQILDDNRNIINEEKIQTKMSVGYFDYDKKTHTIKITNISKNPVNIQVEFGDTNSKEMTLAGVLVVIGSITMILISYMKLKNYNMAQPDENIS